MLQGNKKMTRAERMRALPPLDAPITVRLKFAKVGDLQYISHLDLQRSFNRILVRSGLPVWYSKGFNPHIKLVFSTPLSVGTQSECEFLDIRLDREMPCDEIKDLLNAEMTDELYIKKAYIPRTKFSDIAFCEYEYEICCDGASVDLAESINKLFSESPLNMIKKTKSGEKEIDIIPLIKSKLVWFDRESGTLRIKAVLNATTENFLNPEMLITALKEKLGVLSGDISKEWYTIIRKCSLTEDLSEFK